MTQPLVLWDIDGTLLSTGGSGRAAMAAAFAGLHGVDDAFEALSFAGRTDSGIVAQAYARAGVPLPPTGTAPLHDTYLVELERRLAARTPRLMPGVPSIVGEVGALAFSSLLTGNWREGARRKLAAVQLWSSFEAGAYGDDSPRRDDLVPIARRRARDAGWGGGPVVVIGDTVHDVQCARAGDAIAVAVCTGWGPRADLEEVNPDLLLEDLVSGRDALMRVLTT